MQKIKVARISGSSKLPTRKHPQDAGMDLYLSVELRVMPNQIGLAHTGIVVQIPEGFVGIIKPKGGNHHLIGAGVVDAGYQGEIVVKVANTTKTLMTFEVGHPIGQMLIIPVETPEIQEVYIDELLEEKSARGATGGIHQPQLPLEIKSVYKIEKER
jgi:dUTP pyrophosphatase